MITDHRSNNFVPVVDFFVVDFVVDFLFLYLIFDFVSVGMCIRGRKNMRGRVSFVDGEKREKKEAN